MKVTATIAAVLLTAGLAAAAWPGTTRNEPAQAQQPALTPQRPLVFVPGILGSMLCRSSTDGSQTVVWGTLDAMSQFPTLAVTGADDGVKPCGLIREISYLGVFTQTVYGPLIERLEQAGYREGDTLLVFDYDWRLSVLDNAENLDRFIEANIPADTAFDIVAHSMGGLIARSYAAGGSDPRIARFISAGSPWRGSVQVFELLQNGWGLANGLLGGIEAARRTILSFPSLFEMVPHYEGCCGAAVAGFDISSVGAWTALNWPGIAADTLPDLKAVKARQLALRDILAKPLAPEIDQALVIGVDQRTPEQFDIATGEGEARLTVATSWDGDGTVMRGSASLADLATYPTSFATHDAILSDPSVQDFVVAALEQGSEAAFEAVPVRKRSSIETALGELVQLVGVAIATDEPVYRAGTSGEAIVHLRLEATDPVAAARIELTVTSPGGAPRTLFLAPAPQANDPSNPFEQSLAATFETGDRAGELVLTVTIKTPDATPRVVTRVVPVLAS